MPHDDEGGLEDPALTEYEELNRPMVSVRVKGTHAPGGWVQVPARARQQRENNSDASGRGFRR
jgi:hypothetical protein